MAGIDKTTNIEILDVDFAAPKHASDFSYLIDAYAQDPMGGNTPLTDNVIDSLAKELSRMPHAFSVICYVDSKPAGLINCFEAFSTQHRLALLPKMRAHFFEPGV